MRITVEYFGMPAVLSGRTEEPIELPKRFSVRELVELIAGRIEPEGRSAIRSSSVVVAVNDIQVKNGDITLKDGDRVCFLSAISGG